MRIEARETARLYQVLSDKLGIDTTEAMFKYIESKTEQSVESTIRTLATKDELYSVKDELKRSILSVRDELFTVKADLKGDIADVRKEISESKADTIKWMFIFWIGQVAATLAIILLYVKK